jgi:DeoR family transcriptional regulator, fructose operon transcriptional repressor
LKSTQYAIQRRQMQILQHLKLNGPSSVTALAERFDVAPITIRRDLDLLASKNLVVRRFGSAKITDAASIDEEPTNNISAKKLAIAKKAAEFLVNGDSVFINSSETASHVLSYIKGKSVLVITNNGRSLNVERDPGVELVLTGGEVYGNKHSLVGEFALNAVSKVTTTKCILGVSGISLSGGITSKVLQETTINRTMLNHCNGPKIIVADSSKIGIEHNFYSGKINDITMLITDIGANPDEIERIQNAKIQVVLVDPAEKGI